MAGYSRSTRKGGRIGFYEFRSVEAVRQERSVLVRIAGRALECDMVDLEAGCILAERQPGIDRHAVRLQLEIERDFRFGIPVQRIVAADTEIYRARKKIELRRGGDQVGILGAPNAGKAS